MLFINKILVSFIKLLPQSIVGIFAKKYVAGENLEQAVQVTKDLNAKGIVATMDVLGESITSKEEAKETQKECYEILDAIEKHNLDANLSIKPTSLGLSIDTEFAYELILDLVKYAHSKNNFVRIDMEDSPYTDSTIDVFKRIHEQYPDNVGIVVQAYLKRTYDDVADMNKIGGHYRLCKGIYIEPAEIAYKGKQEVRDNFMKVLERMLDDGNYVGIATHDKWLVDESYKMIERKGIAKDKYEFQMLFGVTERMRDKINEDGHKIRVYVPFGEKWYAYSMRRLQENPNMAMTIATSLFKFN